jgi:Flp pilus assembly protein TadG
MSQMKKILAKREKGQVLVIVALLFIGLVAIIGLAIDMGYYYVSYARLRRAADAAALGATSQYKKTATAAELAANLDKSARQFLKLNGATNFSSAHVETCETTPGDSYLCATPRRKLVRVTVTEDVPLYFLSVIGFKSVPIEIQATSEAASLEVILVIDRSESMSVFMPNLIDRYDSPLDPKLCNENHYCHPFEEVKAAAYEFADKLFYPYDRVAIVTFDQIPTRVMGLSNDKAEILATIEGLTIYEGIETGQGDCGYAYPGPTEGIDMNGPCRLFEYENGDYTTGHKIAYKWLDCPADYPPLNDPSRCQTTNIGGGLRWAAAIFSDPAEGAREEALWVTILLTDGVPNAAYDEDSKHPICPRYTWLSSWGNPKCRDRNALVRHCYDALTDNSSANKYCLNHDVVVDPIEPDPVLDPDKYDADDYARDQADILYKGVNSIIFAIGLGPQVTSTSSNVTDPGTPAAGATLLQYIAMRGDTDNYYQADPDQLNKVFLAIANRIATRLTR